MLPITAYGDAATSSSLSDLGLKESVDIGPNIWRVLASFLFVVALGVGVIWALKRLVPKMGSAVPQNEVVVSHLARHSIIGGPVVHVVEIDGTRFVIASNRYGINMAKLPFADSDASSIEDAE